MKFDENKIYTVSEYIEALNIGLKNFRVKMTGEVSGFKIVPNGHAYFSLKDESGNALIDCKIWKSKYNLFGIDLEDGMRIIVIGNSDIYAPYGKLSFIADTVELTGEGALKKEYEKLKAKLTAEGLFEESRKRPIPKYIQKVGVITSLRAGVVIADLSKNLGNFGFKVQMMDSRVEGQEAVIQLLSAIRTFRKKDIEVLIIMRGGGPLEAMAAFNNETIIRQVANFPVPVIAAIGHEVDTNLVSLVADKAVSTPTAAANFLTEPWKEIELLLEKQERNIFNQYENVLDRANYFINQSLDVISKKGDAIFNQYRTIENKLMVSFQNYKNTIKNIGIGLNNSLKFSFQQFKNTTKNIKSDLNNSLSRTFSGFELLLNRIDQQLEYSEKLIARDNPERQLSLGYSIAVCGGRVVRSIKDVKIGSDINLKVSDGIINSEVKNINNK